MDFLALAQQFGLPVAMLLYAVWMLYTDRVVSGARHRDVVNQRDRLLKLALSGQKKAWVATDLGEALALGAGEEGRHGDAASD